MPLGHSVPSESRAVGRARGQFVGTHTPGVHAPYAALEHGVAGQRDATIRVRLKREGDQVAIEVSDNGVGLKPGFDVGASESLGLRIATMLAKQLRGTFQLEGLDGTTARLVVPA